MGKFGVILGILIVVGVAASYPAWSQVMVQLGPAFDQSNSTSLIPSNSSAMPTLLPAAESTDVQSTTDYGASTTTQNTTPSVPFGSAWVSQFFSIVNSSRGGPSLSPCPDLNAFAALRFQTMTTGTNWEVTHYGYTQDEAQTFGNTPGSFAEDYFYPTTPNPYSPQGFAQFVQATAPGHWSDLMDSTYRYYGVDYQGVGPVVLFRPGCGPTELGPGINQTQLYSGCSPQVVSEPWLVVELASICP